jgi:hypothetical protein
MFISTESRLDIGFSAAQDRLADLACDGLLGRVSGEAYDQWQAGLAQAGSQGTMLGMYRIARVRVTGMVTHGDSALWAIRWEVTGRGGTLVPALDADVKLTPAGPGATVLAVSAVCRPPLVRLGGGLDPAAMNQVARAAIQALTSHIAASVTDPAAGGGASHDRMRSGSVPEPGYRYRTAS